MSLLEALVVIGDPTRPPRERQLAAQGLRSEVRVIVGKVGRTFRGVSEADLEDVTQDIIEGIVGTSARFRGTTPGEAYNWVRRIALNRMTDMWRQRGKEGEFRRRVREKPADRPTGTGPSSETEEGAFEGAPLAPDLQAELGQAKKPLDAMVVRLLSKVQELNPDGTVVAGRQARCFLRYATEDASTEDQIQRLADEESNPLATPLDRKHARDLVYQYRLRGRDVVREALDVLSWEVQTEEEESALGTLRRLLNLERPDEDEGPVQGGGEPS